MKPKPTHFLEHKEKVQLSAQSIRLKNDGLGGADIYSLEPFSIGVHYNTIGLTYKVWEDGTRELCYIVYDNDNVLRLASTRLFTL